MWRPFFGDRGGEGGGLCYPLDIGRLEIFSKGGRRGQKVSGHAEACLATGARHVLASYDIGLIV